MEDYNQILDKLLPALQATRAFHHLEDLEYVAEQRVVLATYKGGEVQRIIVDQWSGRQMINRVILRLR